jgi:hypothetical protein
VPLAADGGLQIVGDEFFMITNLLILARRLRQRESVSVIIAMRSGVKLMSRR